MSATVAGGVLPLASAAALVAARTVPVVWMAPPLGGARLPPVFRVALGSALALLVAPALPPASAAGVAGGLAWGALWFARELLVGVSMGLVVAFAFRAAEAAGRLTDTLRGATLAEALAPDSDARTSPLGALYLLLAVVVFLELGGAPRLLEAVARSYDAVPIAGGGVTAAGATRAAAAIATAAARLVESALAMAAPAVVALWIADLALAFVARAAPQIPVYFVGLPLKGLLGVGVVLVGLATLKTVLSNGFLAWLDLMVRAATSWAASP